MAMNIINISLFLSINVMITPRSVIYFSNKFRAQCRLTVKLRNIFLLRIIGFLVWMLFAVLSVKRRPLTKRIPVSEQYGRDNLIPFLNYVDVQNYIKRLRKHLFQQLDSYETLHFYAVGEYGPVHFRPHYHLLLFTNSEKVAEVLRYCHSKSWKLGRSDFQRSAGGASSYVASYVNSLCSAPLLYRSCRSFRPKSRASVGFFEKGCDFEEKIGRAHV